MPTLVLFKSLFVVIPIFLDSTLNVFPVYASNTEVKQEIQMAIRKTAHYRRANWLVNNEKNLKQVLDDCFEEVDEVVLPSFKVSDSEDCVVARRRLHNNAWFLHFVTYEAGAPTAVIKRVVARDAAELETDEVDPAEGEEFIKAQLFILSNGDNVLWTTHNYPLRERSIFNIFVCFIESRSNNGDDTQFGFTVQLDEGAVARAFDSGIAEIDLGLGSFQPTLERIANGGQLPNDGMMEQLLQVITERPSAEDLEAAALVETKLVFKPGWNWKNQNVKQLMSDLAVSTRNDHEGEFVIVTKSGLRFTQEALSVQKPFGAEGNRRILDSINVETELRGIYGQLMEEGVI